MVARITTGKSIRAMLHYNENKVVANEASLIMASGFAGDIEQMAFGQKLNRFNHLLLLKPNVKTNAVHISLNFHSSENLSQERLQQIGANYMDRIGFGDQPYLVYRHDDAAHSHIHIVTTNITAKGNRIDLHDIGKLLSEPARKAIEEEYKLVKAESKDIKLHPPIKKADIEKIKYGHIPTKLAISNVLIAVNRDYLFTSLAEYNAVLKCFNVVALRGEEHTAMFAKKGLMYSVLDDTGKPIGIPVKASAFYIKPTLRNLEQQFDKHNEKRKVYRDELRKRIDSVFKPFTSIAKSRFEAEADKAGITVVFRGNGQGQLFGVTYIDHKNKCVFNGSDLGKSYSAKGIVERLGSQTRTLFNPSLPKFRPAKRSEFTQQTSKQIPISGPAAFLEMALARTAPDTGTSFPKRKKRKKKQQELTL